jgi:glycosyltransferase involved in cell wall biosynthesis
MLERPPLLSIRIPTYRAEARAAAALAQVLAADTEEIVACDDASDDRTAELAALTGDPRVRLLRHDTPRGQCVAIRTALADAHNGSRFLADPKPVGMSTPRIVASRVLSITANLLYGMSITDEAACLKLFRTEVLRSVPRAGDGAAFSPCQPPWAARSASRLDLALPGGLRDPLWERPKGFSAEVIALLGRAQIEVVEAPIAPHAAGGHALRWRDGARARWILVKNRVRRG